MNLKFTALFAIVLIVFVGELTEDGGELARIAKADSRPRPLNAQKASQTTLSDYTSNNLSTDFDASFQKLEPDKHLHNKAYIDDVYRDCYNLSMCSY